MSSSPSPSELSLRYSGIVLHVDISDGRIVGSIRGISSAVGVSDSGCSIKRRSGKCRTEALTSLGQHSQRGCVARVLLEEKRVQRDYYAQELCPANLLQCSVRGAQ